MGWLILMMGLGIFVTSAQAVLQTVTYTPNPVDLNDLDHHSAYTWRIDNMPNVTVLSATISFDNIANWDANANRLFMWLLDTSRFAGVASFIDDPTNSAPVTDITDDFSNTRYHSNPNWLFAPGTAKTKLHERSFTMTPIDWTYTFSATELTRLNTYIANGQNIALGFDPDCHYFNDGISFQIKFDLPTITPIPEASTFLPMIGFLGLVSGVQWFRRRNQATEA